MKRLYILGFALVFAGSFVFAQNTSTTTQNGNANQAEIDQTGTNSSETVQTSTGNYGNSATVTQNGGIPGFQNLSTISQNTWGEGHNAVVKQNSGSSNFSNIIQQQRNAEASVEQIGNENKSNMTQAGPNEAIVLQQGDENILGSYKNYTSGAYQKNGTSVANDKNWLDLEQTGDDNKAGLWQEHHAAAVIQQLGSDNTADIYQKSNPAGGLLNNAELYQTGNDNTGDINQIQEGQAAVITQSGGWNDAVITQEAGDNNFADAYQSGNENDAVIAQSGRANNAEASQTGNDNYASVNQNAAQFFNTAEVIQDGLSNTAIIEQINEYVHGSAASLFTARQEQLGNNNEAKIHQQGFRWGTNSADQFQNGGGNSAVIEQLAAAASGAKQVQTGNSNTAHIQQGPDLSKTSSINYGYAEINQLGSESYSQIDQISGNYLKAYSTQNGFGNKSEISQTGIYGVALGNTATVIQNGAASSSGFVNIANIMQNGDGNTALITQTYQ